MRVTLAVRNDTAYAGCFRLPNLRSLAKKICMGEGVPGDVEISLLLCGDGAMRELNRQYAGKNKTTDVLSFPQEGVHLASGPRALGDIVISLDTVAARCDGVREDMFEETRLLFCHGLLHLLGFDHQTMQSKKLMVEKQALYLECEPKAAWFRGH